MLRSLCTALLLAHTALSSCVDPAPLSLPITNVRLDNGYTKRGIPGSIGNPPQHFSFMPQNFLNDTWVYNTSAPFCINGTTDNQCLTQRGGLYNPGSSSTSHAYPNVYAAGADASDTGRVQATHIWYNAWATDDFVVDGNILPDFPIGMAGLDFGGRLDTQAVIGLGTNSTILTALKDAAHISSRTWSYWWGIDSTSSAVAMDGQLVFGGYDAAKVTGPNVTSNILPWTLACPSGMYVTVISMALNFPNGTTADMLSPSTLSACLQPDFPVTMTVSDVPFYQRFEELTDTYPMNNSLGTYWYTPIYPPTSVFSGDLTIGLANGLNVKIPNDVLVVSEQYVGPSGAVETNSSASIVLLGPDSDDNTNDTPIIGMQFFSGAYLMVDLDAGTFTLWQANATTDSRLVSVGGECSETPAANGNVSDTASTNQSTATSSTSSTSTSSPNSSSAASSSPSHGMSTGAIVGAAIGGAVALIASAIAILLICMKRRRAAKGAGESSFVQAEEKKTPVSYDSSVSGPGGGWYYGQPPGVFEPMSEQINEMSATQADPHELSSAQKPLEMSAVRADPHEFSSPQKPVEMPKEMDVEPVEMAAVQTPRLAKAKPGLNRRL